ncbi:MAG: hypothetical protein CSB47_10385 [Proteobacteria bacterium]|nr:MAG: hypothetical protein CSB47_10385 [Pseudomonadota bacterium]
MPDTILRIPDELLSAISAEAVELGLSTNSLMIKVLSERYSLPFDSAGNRTPNKYFQKGELHQIITKLIADSNAPLSTGDIAGLVIQEKNLHDSPDLPSIRRSISNILSGMHATGLIKKAGTTGRNNLWTNT